MSHFMKRHASLLQVLLVSCEKEFVRFPSLGKKPSSFSQFQFQNFHPDLEMNLNVIWNSSLAENDSLLYHFFLKSSNDIFLISSSSFTKFCTLRRHTLYSSFSLWLSRHPMGTSTRHGTLFEESFICKCRHLCRKSFHCGSRLSNSIQQL